MILVDISIWLEHSDVRLLIKGCITMQHRYCNHSNNSLVSKVMDDPFFE